MAFYMMIRDLRDVEEDPLSPALRDIERGGGGTRTALDTRWLRLLCLVCWCRGEALKVKKRPLRLSSTNECRQFLNQV